MKLSDLLTKAAIPAAVLSADPDIEGISEDSRTIQSNYLFFARRGAKSSGLDHLKEAVRKGAKAVISEESIADLPMQVPLIVVPSIAESQSQIANAFYGNPSRSLTVVGVTGTNGKTTFTYLLESILASAQIKSGVIGTINYRLPKLEGPGSEAFPAPNTTPNALDLQKILHTMKQRGTKIVAMEVSSHALAFGRTNGIEFDGAVFTNLTQDHLDFHGTMEQYFESKLKLFTSMKDGEKILNGSEYRRKKFCVINLDDPYGKLIVPKCPVPVKTYGVGSACDYCADAITVSASGTSFTVRFEGKSLRIRSPLIGMHNVYNMLAAFSAARQLDIPAAAIQSGLENLSAVPGRLEPVQCGQDFTVLVDYAHTEDALKNVLTTLQGIKKNRILTLFGCGGDRDRSKRPAMGACAVHLSDYVIVTSDNPRTESPQEIALDIEVGIHKTQKNNYEVIVDREAAIKKIIGLAQKNDIVLLAGKGHETYQIFEDKTIHFDDREIAKKYLCSR